jgi:hypothetical protein
MAAFRSFANARRQSVFDGRVAFRVRGSEMSWRWVGRSLQRPFVCCSIRTYVRVRVSASASVDTRHPRDIMRVASVALEALANRWIHATADAKRAAMKDDRLSLSGAWDLSPHHFARTTTLIATVGALG